MGWFFKKKKDVTIADTDEQSLNFPSSAPPERVIEPEEVKEAAGITRPVTPFEFKVENREMLPMPQPQPLSGEPLYIKVDVYQRILGELESLSQDLNNLKGTSDTLKRSEFNEENCFDKLKRNVRLTHDRLLEVDRILFKT